MRVIAGRFKGRKLKSVPGMATRPPLSRLRRAVFDKIEGSLACGPFLDLFAGTGSYVIEALSRGASRAVAVDISRQALGTLRQNLATVGAGEEATILLGDSFAVAERLIDRHGPFGVVAVAPPYSRGMEERMLGLLDRPGLLAPEGVLFAQHSVHDEVPVEWLTLAHLETRRYGETGVAYFSLKH